VYGGQISVADGEDTPTFNVGYREEPVRVDGLTVTDRSVGVTVLMGSVALSASAGQRRARDERLDFASGGVSINLSRQLNLDASAGSYPSNRLLGSAGGRYVSARLTVRFGNAADGQLLPRTRGVPSPKAGVTRLSIRAPNASTVTIAGDWNAWQPTNAARDSAGVWYADVALDAGQYRYAFRIDNGPWRVPEGAAVLPDGFGGQSALVTVSGADRPR